ncbi:MAG: 1-deoxy-D-xylulose-5-phosphate synthase [Oscillospiraceae bacterium]|nr:1-deoxy-D-xylulose-5-phosphate synthase [Oscillospiraceae bacterium]
MNFNFLDKINSPQDLKKLSNQELNILCSEIREQIINTISKTGGHIASSLGVVELTVALHKIFNSPNDKIVWDVGHQAYAHKLLTGRRKNFHTIRQENGLSGFPRQSESDHDAFIAGHSSTSISAACGICKADEILYNSNNFTIVVIGDGSLTGGLSYEGLNNASQHGREKLIVILNDNNMSISKNVGAIAKYLSKIRSAKGYFKIKDKINNSILKIPVVGESVRQALIKSKSAIKETIYHSNFFENLGFEYLGPIDGHDLDSLFNILQRAKDLSKPVFIHIRTIKGKGLRVAEKDPCQYHGISKQDPNKISQESFKDFSEVFGDEILKIASVDKKIIAITAAMRNGTGLEKFSKKLPKQFFDVGIAEQHAVTFAAGLASKGCIPVFAVYSSFLQRSFDQIIHDAAIENQHIVLAIDRAGVVGEDGETHQGIFDVSFLSLIPGVTIFAPSNYSELRKFLNIAIYECPGVVAVRYPRGKESYLREKYVINNQQSYHIWHENNSDTLIITYGRLFSFVCDFKDSLELEQKNISILKLDKIWPLDNEIIILACRFKKIIFIEESIKNGSIAEHFGIKLLENNYNGKYIIKSIDNQFVGQASVNRSLEKLGFNFFDLDQILNKI